MKKRGFWLFLLLLACPAIMAADDYWFYTNSQLDLNMSISSELIIKPEASNYELNQATASLSLFPRNTARQSILSMTKEPENEEINDTIVFMWQKPEQTTLKFRLYAEVRALHNLKKVKEKVRFPVQSVPNEILLYTLPTKTIDYENEGIIETASTLAEGEDDLYVVAHKIAQWVKSNCVYDLRYATSVEKASYVFEKRRGTCDEFTTLFIALCRSVGIPARYISGVAYSNIEQIQGFGPHAWAEVYFPDYGWIPFDILYNELGYIDASHVELKSSLDSDESSVQYSWEGRNLAVDTTRLEIETWLMKKGDPVPPLIKLEAHPLKPEVGFGSYNLIEVTATNLYDYYIPAVIYISRMNELEITGDTKASVLFRPLEQKKLYWLVRVSDTLDRNFMYTFQTKAYTMYNATSILTFTAGPTGPVFSKEEIESVINTRQEEEEKTYSKNVNLSCGSMKDSIYVGRSTNLECYIKNTGNSFLKELSVCLGESCNIINLGIAQQKTLEYPFSSQDPGKKELIISAKNEQVTKAYYLTVEVLPEPTIDIVNLTYPANTTFNQDYQITFVLKLGENSKASSIKVILNSWREPTNWDISELEENKKFIINQRGSSLRSGPNDFNLTVEYEDKDGRKYFTNQIFSINLERTSTIQKMSAAFGGAGFSWGLLIMIAIVFLAGLTVGYILNRPKDY